MIGSRRIRCIEMRKLATIVTLTIASLSRVISVVASLSQVTSSERIANVKGNKKEKIRNEAI